MLDNKTIKQIEDFVNSKPRSIQEISEHLKKNWRTVDRYIKQIKQEYGTIETRTFREGTRGALKIVYSQQIEKISHTAFQERLEQEIMGSRKKEDFSAFDIFQHVKDKNKKAIIEKALKEETTNIRELIGLIKNTKKELLLFSGNLSFINIKQDKIDLFKPIEELVKKGVKIKVLCRVDISGKENIERMLSLNFKYGKNLIEIKHREQPLRAFVFDNKTIRIKEIKKPMGKINELNKKLFIFYTIKDKDWAEWSSKIFRKMFNDSIGVEKRLEEINKIIK